MLIDVNQGAGSLYNTRNQMCINIETYLVLSYLILEWLCVD